MLVKVADDLVSICLWNRSHLLVQLVMVWVATKLRCPIVQFIPPKCNGFRGLKNLDSWTLFGMVQPVSNGSIAVSLQVFIMESKNCEEAPCRQMGVLHAKEPSLYMIKYLKTKVYLKKKTLDNPGWWGDVQLFKSMAWDVLIIVFPSSFIVRDILCHIRYCTLGMVWCAWYGCPDRSNPLYYYKIPYIFYKILRAGQGVVCLV